MKNTSNKQTSNWMNKVQKVVGYTLLAGALSACGAQEDLNDQNAFYPQWHHVESAEQNQERIALPEMESLAESNTAEPTEISREAMPQLESQDSKRVFYFGDIRVESAAELKEFHHYTHVVGNIEIATDDDQFIAWPELRAVAGDLVVSENVSMTRVEFPQLNRVYGALLLNANPKLEEFAMEELSRVTDRIYITKNFSLSDCLVQKLEEDLAKAGNTAAVVSFHNQEGNDCSEILD